MKQYNCPDCERTDSCDGCPRTSFRRTNNFYSDKSITWNDPCESCSNNRKNGGSGVCHCVLGNQTVIY